MQIKLVIQIYLIHPQISNVEQEVSRGMSLSSTYIPDDVWIYQGDDGEQIGGLVSEAICS